MKLVQGARTTLRIMRAPHVLPPWSLAVAIRAGNRMRRERSAAAAAGCISARGVEGFREPGGARCRWTACRGQSAAPRGPPGQRAAAPRPAMDCLGGIDSFSKQAGMFDQFTQ
jgi:hypothetical protein